MAHAALLVDQACRRLSGRLVMPPNITLIPLPAKCPQLNPQENVWQFLRDNWLSNTVFENYDAIVGHCCEAWNKLIAQPWRIMSIGMRDWPMVLINKSWFSTQGRCVKFFVRCHGCRQRQAFHGSLRRPCGPVWLRSA